jgi:hypothetical protein
VRVINEIDQFLLLLLRAPFSSFLKILSCQINSDSVLDARPCVTHGPTIEDIIKKCKGTERFEHNLLIRYADAMEDA